MSEKQITDDESLGNKPEIARSSSRRILKGLLLTVLIGGPVIFALLFALGIRPGIYYRLKYDTYYDFGVEIEAEGKRYELYSEFHCRTVGWTTSLSGEGTGPQRARGWTVLAKRLPSGAAVLVETPNLCRQSIYWDSPFSFSARSSRREIWLNNRPHTSGGWRKYKDWSVPQDFVPFIFWLNDASEPTVIEQYKERSYYQQADARVKIHRVWGGIRFDADPVDPTHELPILKKMYGNGLGDHPYTRPKITFKYAPFYGYSAVPIPQEVWSLGPKLSKLLTALTKPTVIRFEQEGLSEAFKEFRGILNPLTTVPHYSLGRLQTHTVLQAPPTGRIRLPDGSEIDLPAENIFTFRGDYERLNPDLSLRGVHVYYRKEDNKPLPRSYIGDTVLSNLGTYFYDPTSRTLYLYDLDDVNLWRFWRTK